MDITSYDILIYTHTLLFVYWLGGDLGVFFSAKFVANRELKLEERFRFLHLLMQCDMGPRTALIGIIPIGFQMASMSGLLPEQFGNTFLASVWAGSAIWLAGNWWLFFNERHPNAEKFKFADTILRYAILISMASLGSFSLIYNSVITDKWLASKILLFSIAVALGLYLRSEIKNWIIGFGMIRSGGQQAIAGNDLIETALNRSKVAALLLWFTVAVIAFLGKVKPF